MKENTQKCSKDILNRGGTLELDTIEKPPSNYQNTIHAITQALQLEKKQVNS